MDLDDRNLTEARCPAALAPLLRRGRDSYGFNFCYKVKTAQLRPFPEVAYGEDATWLKDVLAAGPERVCFLRDAAAAVLHVQHGANASRALPRGNASCPLDARRGF